MPELNYASLSGRNFPSPISRVYLFHGGDDASKQEGVARLTDPLIDPSAADFDKEIRDIPVSGSDGQLATEILAAAGGVPMFSDRRVVVVTNVQRLGKEDQ